MGAEDASRPTDRVIEQLKATFTDASRVLLFNDKNEILYCSFQPPSKEELSTLRSAMTDRNLAISAGLTVQGRRYEVHRFHPPLVYGRSMDGNPEESTGVALCSVPRGLGGSHTFCLITYEMPQVSARMVQMLSDFCEHYVAGAGVKS